MTRIPTPPGRGEVAASEQAAYDTIMELVAARGDGELSDLSTYTAAMLSTPLFGVSIRELGRATRVAPGRVSTYTRVDFELMVHALGVEADLIEHHHILDALALGVRPEALEAIAHGRLEALGADEHAVVDFSLRLARRTMTDDAWAAVRALRGERGVLDLSIVAGFTWATIVWRLAWGVTGVPVDEVDALLREHRAGTLELPDARTATRAGGS